MSERTQMVGDADSDESERGAVELESRPEGDGATEDEGDARAREEVQCPECEAQTVESRTIYEHKPCGHVEEGDTFAEAARIACPDCGDLEDDARLEAVGVVYSCSGCGEVYDVPPQRASR